MMTIKIESRDIANPKLTISPVQNEVRMKLSPSMGEEERERNIKFMEKCARYVESNPEILSLGTVRGRVVDRDPVGLSVYLSFKNRQGRETKCYLTEEMLT